MRGDQCVRSYFLVHIKLKHRYLKDRLITSKDHASVQISIADVDANGKALGTSTSFALCGQVRSQGESDDSLNRLATKEGCESILYLNPRLSDLEQYSAEERMVLPKVIGLEVLGSAIRHYSLCCALSL